MGLMNSLNNIRDYAAKKRRTSSNRTPAALDDSDVPQRDQMLDEFRKQIEITKGLDAKESDTISLWGFAGMVIIFLAEHRGDYLPVVCGAQPLAQLVEALERMRQGDFTQRIEDERNDEFGIVGDGLNRLADDLSVLVGHVQRSGIQVNTTATQIAATARQQQKHNPRNRGDDGGDRGDIEGDFGHFARTGQDDE